MNTQLEKLFEKYNFSQKDRYDFLQIYALLPSYKKVKVVEHFDEITTQIHWLRKDLYEEQEILFGETLQHIEEKLSKIIKKRVLSGTKQEISLFKKTI